MSRLSPAMMDALRDAAAGALYARREDGTYVRDSTVTALINRDLLWPGFPHGITNEGLRVLIEAGHLPPEK